ncbi:TlpA disulfide reductase family protein [Malaciobacter marinus]|jgi:thiol-disulfide isomerase/thioredoxin|uniref:TlpA family protein disulfide reductase n=1 Tax=Malaciobacter TaxID=2321114 RepID=UPI0009A665FB|nr:TlpA disulfide reductase family protein [Malaciobacter marinus]SKB27898.1 Thiol-disulfide isomerase or thioredoxin [Malaciobacter marinus]
MKKLYLFTLVIFAVIFTGCGSEDEAQAVVIKDSKSFKELKKQGNKTYSLETTAGETIKLTVENDKLTSEDLKNKVVLINFWATWCPPCKEEIPMFNRVYEKYQDDFVIIGVLYEKNKDMKALADFMREFNMKFPVTINEQENFRMAKNFDDVKRVPESFLYGKDGKFLEKFVGLVDEQTLLNHIENSLK